MLAARFLHKDVPHHAVLFASDDHCRIKKYSKGEVMRYSIKTLAVGIVAFTGMIGFSGHSHSVEKPKINNFSGIVKSNKNGDFLSSQAIASTASKVGWKEYTCSYVTSYYDSGKDYPYITYITNKDKTTNGSTNDSYYLNSYQQMLVTACQTSTKKYSVYFYNTSGNWNAIKF